MKRFIVLAVLFIVLTFAISQVSTASSLSIDRVYGGTWEDGWTVKLFPDEDVHFDIRFTDDSGLKIGGIANGFRVWTTGGSSFTPLFGEAMNQTFVGFFDLGFFVNHFSADGIGADTVGFGGATLGQALPIDFDDIVYRITTGGIQEGETLCIDSSFYPPLGTWKWAAGATNIFPNWNGPMCFTAECPETIPPFFTNCVDTLTNTNCDQISYTYNADSPGSIPTAIIRFFKIDGPGTIDSLTGEWSNSISPEDLGTYDTLIVGTYDLVTSKCNFSTCTSIIQLISEIPADLNDDCSADISDLVLMVQFMFNGGPPPTPLMAADMNADSVLDIADMVWIVNYMFNSGPPPIG